MDKKTNKKKLRTVVISTTLFDNVAFVFFYVMETFSKDCLEVRGLRSRGCFFPASVTTALGAELKKSVTISVG